MYKFSFTLNKENAEELNDYLALHDASIQKKMLSFTIMIGVIMAAVSLLIFGLSPLGLVCAAALVLLDGVFFPKIYWRIVFARVKKVVENRDLKFSKTTVSFDNTMKVADGSSSYSVELENIEAFDFTKNNCLVFFEREGKRNTMIIPNEVIGERLAEFGAYLKEVVDKNGQGKTTEQA